MSETPIRHYVTLGPYGGSCTCGKVFRARTKFGADALKGYNLARANATRHEKARRDETEAAIAAERGA